MRFLAACLVGLVSCAAPAPPPGVVRSDDAAAARDLPGVDAFDSPDAAMDALAEAGVVDRALMPDGAPASYPPGPYGSGVGQVVANLPWEGYVNDENAVVSSALPFGATDIAAVRGAGAPFALVHLSGFL